MAWCRACPAQGADQIGAETTKTRCDRYQDIANLALSVRQKRASSATGSQSRPRHSSQHQTDVMVQVAQELYRVVLFAVFLAQTYVAGLLPGFGEGLAIMP